MSSCSRDGNRESGMGNRQGAMAPVPGVRWLAAGTTRP
jgi:hypothetical protein